MYFKINKRLFVHKAFILLPLGLIFGCKAKFYSIMLLCAVLHEGAHALTAAALGEKTEKIFLSPYGCELRLACVLPSYEVFILLSGPVFSLILSLGTFFLGFKDICRANAVLFSLNMLPAYPLDGGKILKIMLWHIRGVYRGNKALKRISFTVALCLSCAALPLNSVWLAVIAFLIFRRAKSLHGTPFYKKRKLFTPVKAFCAAPSATVLEALRLFSPYYYTCIFIESKNKLLTERDIIAIAQESGYTKIL